jgi:peptidoglycan DL-endopeptidase CwlO
MASHSRVVPRRITVSRTALTLAAASAASVGLLAETSRAQPPLSPAEVKDRVDALYQQAEQATEEYDGAKVRADAARSELDGLQDELARKTARLNAARDEVGSLAAAQYRSGGIDPAVQVALSSAPDTYLERTALLNQAGYRTTAALSRLAAEQRSVARTRAEAATRAEELRSAERSLAAREREVRAKLRAARDLLAVLTPGERGRILASEAPPADPVGSEPSVSGPSVSGPSVSGPSVSGPSVSGPSVSEPSAPAPSPRAAQAVAYAYRALGTPYVWGATGPHAYDCSGLTQAAWKSAGVALPRTTYTQVNAGTRVSGAELRPGDLVFFYSGITHVGIYVGGGRMIHAPHPGAAVRIDSVSGMPFAAATRPA